MSESAERRRHRLATGIFHQPTVESRIEDAKRRMREGITNCDERMYEKAQADLEKLCPSSDKALAGSSDVVPPRPVIREDGLGQPLSAEDQAWIDKAWEEYKATHPVRCE